MTTWQVSGIVLGMMAYVLAWVRGGRPERLAVGIMVLFVLLSSLTYTWQVGGFRLVAMGLDFVRLLVFGWLCFRFDRWWLFILTAALALMVFLHLARLLDPSVTQFALVSAHVGLGYLIDLALLFSVFERWLAGEPAAGPDAWSKAGRTTAARRALRGKAPVERARQLRPMLRRGRNRPATQTFFGPPTIGDSG